jgi:hypothetical protein
MYASIHSIASYNCRCSGVGMVSRVMEENSMLPNTNDPASIKLFISTLEIRKSFCGVLIETQLQRWLNSTNTLSETYKSFTIHSTYSSDRNFIAVFEERPLLISIQRNEFLAVLTLF